MVRYFSPSKRPRYVFHTSSRRGEGVFEKVSSSFDLLKKRNIFYGISMTVTSENFDGILDEKFIKSYIDKGCKAFFFIKYVPFDSTTENLVISEAQRIELDNRLRELREKYKGIFIAFPGDEKEFGGCLAAGRGGLKVALGKEKKLFYDVKPEKTKLKENEPTIIGVIVADDDKNLFQVNLEDTEENIVKKFKKHRVVILKCMYTYE